MTFQDEPKLVYSCKLLDIYFSRKKKYFWQILLIFLSNPKFQENQCFFMKLLIWMKLKLQNFSKKLFWIKTRVKISKLVIKVNWHSTFWLNKFFFCIIQKFTIVKKWYELNGLKMVNYAKLNSKLVKNIFSFLNIKCQIVCKYKLTLVYLQIA